METENPFDLIFEIDRIFNSGDIEKAREISLSSIAKFPELPILYSLLVQIYIKEANYIKANEILERAIKKFPTNRSFKLLQETIPKENVSGKTHFTIKTESNPSLKQNIILNKYAFTTYPFLCRTTKIPINPDKFPFHYTKTPDLEPLRNLGLRHSLLQLLEIS